ncbi:MAG: hypothetical protein ABEJ79_01745 [Halolamina sp.]
MVGPSFTAEERDDTHRLLKIGFAFLVAVSMGMVALQSDPTAVELLAVLAVGLGIGAGLSWFVARNLRRMLPDAGSRRR